MYRTLPSTVPHCPCHCTVAEEEVGCSTMTPHPDNLFISSSPYTPASGSSQLGHRLCQAWLPWGLCWGLQWVKSPYLPPVLHTALSSPLRPSVLFHCCVCSVLLLAGRQDGLWLLHLCRGGEDRDYSWPQLIMIEKHSFIHTYNRIMLLNISIRPP